MNWDLVLVLAVTAQATLMAYVYHPQAKAFVYSIPMPFTVAALAVGKPVNAGNVAGLALLFSFTHLVRYLNARKRVPIVVSIIIAAITYCALGALLAKVLPQTALSFWLCCFSVMVLAYFALRFERPLKDSGFRTPLPLWIKLPCVAAVVLVLVALKPYLQSFMTMFPMVGVIGLYETRYSLNTMRRQMTTLMVSLLALIITCYLVQPYWGLPGGLVAGWIVFYIVMYGITKWRAATTVEPLQAPA